jgi:hypothetical protein
MPQLRSHAIAVTLKAVTLKAVTLKAVALKAVTIDTIWASCEGRTGTDAARLDTAFAAIRRQVTHGSQSDPVAA